MIFAVLNTSAFVHKYTQMSIRIFCYDGTPVPEAYMNQAGQYLNTVKAVSSLASNCGVDITVRFEDNITHSPHAPVLLYHVEIKHKVKQLMLLKVNLNGN